MRVNSGDSADSALSGLSNSPAPSSVFSRIQEHRRSLSIVGRIDVALTSSNDDPSRRRVPQALSTSTSEAAELLRSSGR
jgi:hypothetical protein